MADSDLRYDAMVEDALRGVVRRALELAAKKGLPGDHHFYITFRTDHPGVRVPVSLRERYPAEMTIVLQYQFWALKVDEEAFQVTLSFNDKPERLFVPLAAVTAFADPSVRFGLQFAGGAQESAEEIGEGLGEAPSPAEGQDAGPKSLPAAGPKPEEPRKPAAKRPRKKTKAEVETDAEGKIVTLDAFRKK